METQPLFDQKLIQTVLISFGRRSGTWRLHRKRRRLGYCSYSPDRGMDDIFRGGEEGASAADRASAADLFPMMRGGAIAAYPFLKGEGVTSAVYPFPNGRELRVQRALFQGGQSCIPFCKGSYS